MNSKEKVIIFITAGKWQLNGIKIAKKQGLEILSIDSDPNAEGFKYSKYKINLELNKKKRFLKFWQYNLNYVGVLSYCSEVGMELASYISDYYNLYAPSIKTANILVNKEKRDIYLRK